MTISTALSTITSEIPSIASGFYKPVKISIIENLVYRYQQTRKMIDEVRDLMESSAHQNALSHYLRGAELDERQKHHISFNKLMNYENAIRVLNSDHWREAMKATDVYQHMPEKRHQEWDESIREGNTPDFEVETVVSTLKDLILSRDKFLAERIDGIFKNLSGEHVTNSPQGFNKKMIMYYVTDTWGPCHQRAGYISDLRAVIAKFMDRPAPCYSASNDLVKTCLQNYGQWHEVDGGAFRIKVFLKGTAHIEVHPDIAWRLNDILSFMYPMAIPSEFRKRPEKKYKEFKFTQNLIDPKILDIIRNCEQATDFIPIDPENRNRGFNRKKILNEVDFKSTYPEPDKELLKEAGKIMKACGGMETKRNRFKFDYDFIRDVKGELCMLGAVPNKTTHQYYPTPENIAKYAVELAEISDNHKCLEPSAGQGGLAKFMPVSTDCVELSDLHCAILKGKGLQNVYKADFIQWAKDAELYDRIVMNPPFSQGRVEQHLTTAARLLKEGGILTIICPPSAKKLKKLDGFEYEYSKVFSNEFSGTNVDVIVMKLTRKLYA